jgi:hypothetical protein
MDASLEPINPLEHFQENARPRGGGVDSGFPSDNATM